MLYYSFHICFPIYQCYLLFCFACFITCLLLISMTICLFVNFLCISGTTYTLLDWLVFSLLLFLYLFEHGKITYVKKTWKLSTILKAILPFSANSGYFMEVIPPCNLCYISFSDSVIFLWKPRLLWVVNTTTWQLFISLCMDSTGFTDSRLFFLYWLLLELLLIFFLSS